MGNNISERVAKAITESRHTEDEISEMVGKAVSTVYRWRNKETTNYPKKTLKDIANATEVRYDWLRYGDGPMKEDNASKEPASPEYLEKEVSDLERLLSSGKVGKPSRADAIRALEVAESMIRSAKELLKRGYDSDD